MCESVDSQKLVGSSGHCTGARRTKAWDKSFLHLDTLVFIKIDSVYGNLKDLMELDLCI